MSGVSKPDWHTPCCLNSPERPAQTTKHKCGNRSGPWKGRSLLWKGAPLSCAARQARFKLDTVVSEERYNDAVNEEVEPARALEAAEEAARVAGEILLGEYPQLQNVREVTRHDVKLDVDVRCEEAIQQVIRRHFPRHGFLAEESGDRASSSSPYLWVVDPLDGTVNFYHGVPHFSVSIALAKEGKTLVGVVLDPVRDEMFTAVSGKGALLNGAPIHVASRARMSECIACGGLSKLSELVEDSAGELLRLVKAVRKVRITGSAALDICYVACGRFDLYREVSIMRWDIAAGFLIATEAGGTTYVKSRHDSGGLQAVVSYPPVDRDFLKLLGLQSLTNTGGRSSLQAEF